MPNTITQLGMPNACSYLHARLGGAHGPARSTGMARATGQTHLALPLVATLTCMRHARLGGAYGPARSTGMVRATGQTHLALPLVALADPKQRSLAKGRRILLNTAH